MSVPSVTIFGGSGFIGRYVVARMASRGWLVRVAVRRPDRARFLQPLGNVGQITTQRCNLLSDSQVEAALRDADAAVNLVGILYETGRQRFAEVHHRSAERVAQAAAAAGVSSFVQMSAIGADSSSVSSYARSKAAGEKAVRAALPQATILRPSVVFGPEDDFFNRFAVMARLSLALPLIGGGHTRFQPVYVGDVADAVVKSLTNPACRGRTYELGGPRIYSFRELMELLLRVIRRHRLLLPLPFALADVMAAVAELLPAPPLTRDQVALLRSDNVVTPGAATLADLGIAPHSVEIMVSTYLERYRPGGQFSERAFPSGGEA